VTYTKAAGPVAYVFTGFGQAINILDAYTVWRGIDITFTGNNGIRVVAQSGYSAGVPGVTIQNVTVAPAVSGGTAFNCEKLNTSYPLGTAAEPIRILNCVSKSVVAVGNYVPGTGHTTGAHILVVNCTHLGDGVSANQVWNWAAPSGAPDSSFKIINCANLASTASNDANILGGGAVDVSGSGYNVGNSAAPTASFRFENIAGGIGSQYTPTTDTDPGPGDWAIYDAATGALINDSDNDVLAGGVGPSANSDVPETDIVGNLRSGSTADPGAFEISSIPVPLPGLSSDMQQTYQAEAAYTLALTPSGVTNVTHQLAPGPADYLRVNNSTRSREVKFPDGVQAVRVVALADQKPCSVTVVLSDGAGGETESDIGYVGGGVIQAESPYLWNLSALQSDGTYPKLKFTREGEWIGNQDIYVWWHTS
jgi:hypothetical protein